MIRRGQLRSGDHAQPAIEPIGSSPQHGPFVVDVEIHQPVIPTAVVREGPEVDAYNIRSNCILPGAVETPMQDRWKKIPNAKKNLKEFMPIKKVIQPEGIAQAILFLLSDQSEYITGTELIIDGGLTARP